MVKRVRRQRPDPDKSGVRVVRIDPGPAGSAGGFPSILGTGTGRTGEALTKLGDAITRADSPELTPLFEEVTRAVVDRDKHLLARAGSLEQFLLRLHRPEFMRIDPCEFTLNDVMRLTEGYLEQNIKADKVVIRLFEDPIRPGQKGNVDVAHMYYDPEKLNPQQRASLGGRIKVSAPHMKLILQQGGLTVDDANLAQSGGFVSNELRDAFPDLDKMHNQALGGEGVITCLRSGESFTEDEITLIGVVGSHVTGIIRDHRMRERDPFLTQLYSKGQSQKLVAEGIEQAIRRGPGEGSVCLIAWDIDHFSGVNNEHGHGVGDVVLGEVAELMTSSFRTGDKVIRAGGEEIWAIMPGCPLKPALAKAEIIRASMEDRFFADISDPKNKGVGVAGGLKITISGGVSELRVDEQGRAVLDGKVLRRFGDVTEAVKDGGRRGPLLADLCRLVAKHADDAERHSKECLRN